MAFDEVVFPLNFALKSKAGLGFRTTITQVSSGAEERIINWQLPKRTFSIAAAVLSESDLKTLQEFYWERQGAAHGFLFPHPKDKTTATDWTGSPAYDDVVIGTGDGSETQFQLIKKYGGTSRTLNWTILKPKTGTTAVGINGVEQATGWTVDLTTGQIQFVAAPTATHDVTAGCEFYIPARFGADNDALLDITWDDIQNGVNIPITIEELKEETVQPDDFFYGGASDGTITLTEDTLISFGNGRLQVFACSTAGVDLHLPDDTQGLTNFGFGIYYYVIALTSGSTQNVTVLDQDDSTLLTLTPGDAAHLHIAKDASGDPYWVAS